MGIQHKILAAGRWHKLSLVEQLGNVGSEIHRAVMFQGKDKQRYQDATDRSFELMDLTLTDKRWRGLRLREIARVREMMGDAILGGREYGTTFEYLDDYFFGFAFAARAGK